jgi:hypothetical protein
LNALKYKLAAAKTAYQGIKCLTVMPDAKALTRAKSFISLNGAELKPDGHNPKRKDYLAILAQHEEVVSYRKEKQRLAAVVEAVQLEMYATATKSDLE